MSEIRYFVLHNRADCAILTFAAFAANIGKGKCVMSEKKENWWNIPNALTVIRLALVPVLWVLMLVYKADYWALGVFVLASMTDILDGYLARHNNQITTFGKLMDPLADKLMTLSVLATLLIRGMISWKPVALLGLKELIMLTGGILLYKRKIVVHSLFVGKLAQTAVCASLFLSFFRDKFTDFSFQPHTALLWIGVGAAYTALIVYIRSVIRQLRGVENTYKQLDE